jgi:hypothetical protein
MGASLPPQSSELLRELVDISGFVTHALYHPTDTIRTISPTVNQLTLGLVGWAFNPTRDIPDLAGKVVFVTGGTDPCWLPTYTYISI